MMPQKTISASHPARRWFVLSVFAIAGALLLARAVDLQVLRTGFLQGHGDARALRVVTVPAHRGVITDRNGEPLAISTPVDSVWVNPREAGIAEQNSDRLAHILGLHVVAEGVETEAQRYFLSTVHHCDYLQGYLLSRPVALADFEHLACAAGPH